MQVKYPVEVGVMVVVGLVVLLILKPIYWWYWYLLMKFVAQNFYFLLMVLSESPTKNGGYSRPFKDSNLKISSGIYLNAGLDGVSV